ncbi:hypothetical protein WKT02_05835 [Erysipelotrichaceae bacterium HCN-30851]
MPKNISIERLEDILQGLILKINKELFKDYQEEQVSVSVGASTVLGNDDSYEAYINVQIMPCMLRKLKGRMDITLAIR